MNSIWERIAAMGSQVMPGQPNYSGYGAPGVGYYKQGINGLGQSNAPTMGQDIANNRQGYNPQPVSLFDNTIGANINTANMAINGLGGLANAYMGYQKYQLGKESFAHNKAMGLANLANNTQAYNQNLENIAANRFAGNQQAQQDYRNQYKATGIKGI